MPYSIENGRIFGILIDNSYTVGSVLPPEGRSVAREPVCNLFADFSLKHRGGNAVFSKSQRSVTEGW